MTPTGRGWVEPRAAAALEHLYGGDSAIVSVQYSYLPSPLSLLVDPDRAEQAGERLSERVHDRWSRLPADDRPLLLVDGGSLGSTGGQAAISGPGDLRARTDGARSSAPRSRTRSGTSSSSGGTEARHTSCRCTTPA